MMVKMNQKQTGISEVCTWKLWPKVTSVDQLNYSPCLVTSVLPSSRKPFYCVALSQFRSCQPLNSAFPDPTCQTGWTRMCRFKASSKHGLPSTGIICSNGSRHHQRTTVGRTVSSVTGRHIKWAGPRKEAISIELMEARPSTLDKLLETLHEGRREGSKTSL